MVGHGPGQGKGRHANRTAAVRSRLAPRARLLTGNRLLSAGAYVDRPRGTESAAPGALEAMVRPMHACKRPCGTCKLPRIHRSPALAWEPKAWEAHVHLGCGLRLVRA